MKDGKKGQGHLLDQHCTKANNFVKLGNIFGINVTFHIKYEICTKGVSPKEAPKLQTSVVVLKDFTISVLD